MDPSVDRDSEQEARDCTTATLPSSSTAVPVVEPKSMDYEEWQVQVRSLCGRYSPKGVNPKTFAGSIRPVRVWGCAAAVFSCNVHRVERTSCDARLDGMDHYYAMLYLSGRWTVIQNDRVEQLAAGDIGLMDSTQPMTYIIGSRPGRWLSVHLPRKAVIAHLGFEPEGGLCRRGQTPAKRLFFQLIQDAVNACGPTCASAEPYMQLATYDLLGALFATPHLPSISSGTDKLFKKICNIVRDRFAEPDLSPSQVATEAGISLRYLQQLFSVRNSSYTRFIHSVRLDHAAGLLHRRALLNTGQSISQIAYVCGFGDYTHFARQFRRRFGHSPGAHGRDLTF